MHERLVAVGGRGVRVRRLGGTRAGEVRLGRFLRNPAVSLEEMVATAAARTAGLACGRDVLAIQDTTEVRRKGRQESIALHPTLAVDAGSGAPLGLVHAEFLSRKGGKRARREQRAFEDKESRRWLSGMLEAGKLLEAGASSVTMVADREADIYEAFASHPEGMEMVIRARHDRPLAEGASLFQALEGRQPLGQMTIALAAGPGRKAREARLALRAGPVAIIEPFRHRKPRSKVPATQALWLVEALELEPPAEVEPAHWRLLTTYPVETEAEAQRIVAIYRQRWTIEQLFRTLKSNGFDVEMLRIAEDGPFEKLVAASTVAAVTVLQLVRERDGAEGRALLDALDLDDQPALEAVSRSLEGKTEKQKNPHPKGSLAFAAWVFARLGGWTGYYGKPGPVVILAGLIQFHAVKQGWDLRDV